MRMILFLLFATLRDTFRRRAALQLERLCHGNLDASTKVLGVTSCYAAATAAFH